MVRASSTSVACTVPASVRLLVLEGSWVVISGVISPLIRDIIRVTLLITLLISPRIGVITIVTLLITPLINAHEPPSSILSPAGRGCEGFRI